jgi:nitroreductase
MDFKMLLVNRRSVREFQDREVPLALLEEIIKDSCLAPTASNGQPCRFVIIRDRECLKRLSDESKRNLLADIRKNPDSPVSMYEAVLKDEAFNVFYNAPCAIIVIGPKKVRSLDVDGALTISYLMFSAADRGLGTCWVALGANLRSEAILSEIGVPEDCRIIAPVIIGYPVAIPAASERHAPVIVKII